MASTHLSNEMLALVNERFDFKHSNPRLEKDIELLVDFASSEYRGEDIIDVTAYPLINDFLTYLSGFEHPGDFWQEANEGDVIVKDGYYYMSSVPNGTHVVVKNAPSSDCYYLSPYLSRSVLCFPEEFRVVGNIQEKIDAYLHTKGE